MAKRKAPLTGVKFEADISEITKSLNIMDQIPRHILARIGTEIEAVAREELINVFLEASGYQSDDAFPTEFEDHLIDVVSNAQFQVAIGGTSFEISFDFGQLGNRSDLERAFHQGAFLADGSKLDGPYTGQPLRNPDARERHIYWEAMHKGFTSAPNPKKPGTVPIRPGAWEETKQKYIEIWGDKAPQWLYLQFGQTAWEPKIRSFPIIETYSKTLNEVADQLFFNSVVQEIERAQGLGVTLTPFGGRLNQPTGELGPSGKLRRPGQFYPLR